MSPDPAKPEPYRNGVAGQWQTTEGIGIGVGGGLEGIGAMLLAGVASDVVIVYVVKAVRRISR
jgi:hypothetical protein